MFNRYYEDELNKLKELAVEFSQANPALAPMLSGASADPDVERLLEGVAFLTGLTRQKLDDEFPEFVQELANLLFPHYLRPIPACTLVSFAPKGLLAETVRIPAGTKIDSVPVDGTPCRFRTCADLDVHPLVLSSAQLVTSAGSAARIVLHFELPALDVSQWSATNIRLFLGSGYAEAAKLLLLLTQHVRSVSISAADGAVCDLGARSIRLSGFDAELLPYPQHAFQGYRCLQEFFVQPEKFLFVDIENIGRWTERGKSNAFDLTFVLDQLPEWMPEIRSETFQLNITPAINLFEHAADPVSHDHKATEYRLLPEGSNRAHYQIYSVDRVVGYQQGVARERVYSPFGMLKPDGGEVSLNYRTTLRAAAVGRGSDVYLSVTYPAGQVPVAETLSVQVTCTNRMLPESLKLGDLSRPTDTSPDRMTFRNIRRMTQPLNPPAGEALLWRMISHVSLNFLSIADATNLKALLGLYVFSERQEQGAEAANRRRIESIQDVTATRETRLVGRGSILRGQLVRIKCRLDFFASIGDMYLFGCVLDRFIADYASINSYTRVEIEDAFTGALFKWPPRLGQQPLL
ncbi:MAG: type VI secretion system baseplate subunit TssF [Pseudomonadota bacterium]